MQIGYCFHWMYIPFDWLTIGEIIENYSRVNGDTALFSPLITSFNFYPMDKQNLYIFCLIV